MIFLPRRVSRRYVANKREKNGIHRRGTEYVGARHAVPLHLLP
jgi:hypothetical protein